MKKTLPPELAPLFQAKCLDGRTAWKKGEIAEAEKNFLEAWNLFPSPRYDYDHAQSLAWGMGEFYRDTKQHEKTIEWLDVVREAYGEGDNPSVLFHSATVYFEAGNLDKAFMIFDGLFQKFKARPFQGSKPEYLEFYRKEAAQKKKRQESF